MLSDHRRHTQLHVLPLARVGRRLGHDEREVLAGWPVVHQVGMHVDARREALVEREAETERLLVRWHWLEDVDRAAERGREEREPAIVAADVHDTSSLGAAAPGGLVPRVREYRL